MSGAVLDFDRRCRVCGCTQFQACTGVDGSCHWVQYDLCSACDEAGGEDGDGKAASLVEVFSEGQAAEFLRGGAL